MISALKAIAAVIEFALPFIPDEELSAHLSETARKIADKIADLAQTAKFGA